MEIINESQFMLLSLVLMRISGFILFNPIFGRKNIPMLVKTGLILVLSFVVYSFSQGAAIEVNSPFEYAFLLLKEFAAGYVLGFVMQLFEFVITFAGGIMDFQMGLSMATVFDPQSNTQVPVSGQVFSVYYMLLFFAVDGHLALMKILLTSAEVVPYGKIALSVNMVWPILKIFCECVIMAVKFAFPLLAVEFLTEVAVGILMKIIPQINVFVVNIQAKVIIGLMMLLILFSPMSAYVNTLVTTMIDTLQNVMKLL